jgi:hypothetical protein
MTEEEEDYAKALRRIREAKQTGALELDLGDLSKLTRLPPELASLSSLQWFWCKLLKGPVFCDNCRNDGTDLGTRSVQGTAF